MEILARQVADLSEFLSRSGSVVTDEERPAAVPRRGNLVLVVADTAELSEQLAPICDYVGLSVEMVPSAEDLGMLLDERRPLALIAPFETEFQDGGHVLKCVALYDRDLPVLLLTGRNPVYQGAAEAMGEILQLGAVCLPSGEPTFGELVEFLARASQRNRRRRRPGGPPGLEEEFGGGK